MVFQILFLSLFFLKVWGEPIAIPQIYEKWPKIGLLKGMEPYISRVDFRHMCNHVIDENALTFDPEAVCLGDTVYVKTWSLEWFQKEAHDRIPFPYILVTNDEGDGIPVPGLGEKLLYDSKCAAWFCGRLLFSGHPKLFPLPFGPDILYMFERGAEDLLLIARQKPFVKKHLLYMNHFPRDAGGRRHIVSLFENAPYCFSRNSSKVSPGQFVFQPYDQYCRELADSYFVISPIGYETDCIRTWEALAFECIPIVEHTYLDSLYEGLPIVIVHDWEEITAPFLLAQLERLKDCSYEKSYFPYWRNLILQKQAEVRAGVSAPSHLDATQFSPEDLAQILSILKEMKSERQPIFYRGWLTAMRPLQLLKEMSEIPGLFLFDLWMDHRNLSQLHLYTQDAQALEMRSRMTLIQDEFEGEFYRLLSVSPKASVVIDLTYYRNTLKRSRALHRHSLKDDLIHLYDMVAEGTGIVGNQSSDLYVREVLEKVEEALEIEIIRKGSFWYFQK